MLVLVVGAVVAVVIVTVAEEHRGATRIAATVRPLRLRGVHEVGEETLHLVRLVEVLEV